MALTCPGAAGAGGQAIELHIEELVLYGFDPRQRHAIGDALAGALQQELLAQLAAGGGLATLFAQDGARRLEAADVQLDLAAGPDGIGAMLARALTGALAGPPAEGRAGGEPGGGRRGL